MFCDPHFSLFSVTNLEPNISIVHDWKESGGGVSIEGMGSSPSPSLTLTLPPFLSSPFPQGESAAEISELGTPLPPSNL